MTNDDKLVKKFLSRKNIPVEDCNKIIVSYGYELHKSGGSHRVYHRKRAIPIVVIPKKSKYVNTAYVDLIIKRLKLEA